MNRPQRLTIDELLKLDLKKSAILTLSIFPPEMIKEKFSLPTVVFPDVPPRGLDSLIVIGGGVLIDFAKVWKVDNNPAMKLIAIPSIWGSGAENSPIAVLNEGGKKAIKMGEEFLPDFRVTWERLADSLPPDLVKYACGDVWAHALEGFLSPIATAALRTELSGLIRELIETPIEKNSRWFELSARACAGQAKSSAGLIHGISHILEGPLNKKYPDQYFGHAQLCTTYLYPVMRFNLSVSDKVQDLLNQYDVNLETVMDQMENFYDDELFSKMLPFFEENWKFIIRDPVSRTNCVLVRLNNLEYFSQKKFK